MTHHSRRALFCILVASLLCLAGCGGGSGGSPFTSRTLVTINNVIDRFSVDASNQVNITQTFTETWQNSGATAAISQTAMVTSGTATLTITDAGATQVYSGSLTSAGNFTTTAGAPGAWIITVTFTNLTGTIIFTLTRN